jgi:hypothetical protein
VSAEGAARERRPRRPGKTPSRVPGVSDKVTEPPLFRWRLGIVMAKFETQVAGRRRDQTATRRWVAIALSLHMNRDLRKCFPSITTLAEETGLGRSTVIAALNDLEKEGWIHRTPGGGRRPGSNAPGRPTQYEGTFPRKQQGSNDGTVSRRTVQQTSRNGPPDQRQRSHDGTRGRKSEIVSEDVHPRRRDELFETLARECERDPSRMTRSGRGAMNRAVAELRAVGATPESIEDAAAAYRRSFTYPLTATALAKHYDSLLNGGLRGGPARLADRLLDSAMRGGKHARERGRGADKSPARGLPRP